MINSKELKGVDFLNVYIDECLFDARIIYTRNFLNIISRSSKLKHKALRNKTAQVQKFAKNSVFWLCRESESFEYDLITVFSFANLAEICEKQNRLAEAEVFLKHA